jgi:uncharacterized membrane protein
VRVLATFTPFALLVGVFAAAFLLLVLLVFVFILCIPLVMRLERPPKNSGNIRQELTDVLDCLSGKVASILTKTHIRTVY